MSFWQQLNASIMLKEIFFLCSFWPSYSILTTGSIIILMIILQWRLLKQDISITEYLCNKSNILKSILQEDKNMYCLYYWWIITNRITYTSSENFVKITKLSWICLFIKLIWYNRWMFVYSNCWNIGIQKQSITLYKIVIKPFLK